LGRDGICESNAFKSVCFARGPSIAIPSPASSSSTKDMKEPPSTGFSSTEIVGTQWHVHYIGHKDSAGPNLQAATPLLPPATPP